MKRNVNKGQNIALMNTCYSDLDLYLSVSWLVSCEPRLAVGKANSSVLNNRNCNRLKFNVPNVVSYRGWRWREVSFADFPLMYKNLN